MPLAGKVTKQQAGYSQGAPHCGACKFYSEDERSEVGSCQLVDGSIDEDMWCKLFQAKRKKTLAETAGR